MIQKPGLPSTVIPRICVLGSISFLVGRLILFYVMRRMRTTGELATA